MPELSDNNHNPHHHHSSSHRSRRNPSTTPPPPPPPTLEIPLEHFPDGFRHSPDLDSPPPRKNSNNPKQVRTTTMLTSDWLADMVNNNMAAHLDDPDQKFGSGGGAQNLGPVMQLSNVSVRKDRYDIQTTGPYAFQSLNLTFICGKIFVIIGEPSSGKTALLKTLAKIRRPGSGSVKYLGPPGGGQSGNCRLSSGFMAQKHGFFPEMSPLENLEYLGKLYCVEPVVAHNKLHRLMQMIGWDQKSVPMEQLSPIHQTLVSLALASLHSPAILILDEPNFGADLFLKEHIWRQLKKLTTQEHVTIVFATSCVEDVRFADEAAIVRAKSLIPCVLSPGTGLEGKVLTDSGEDSPKSDDFHNKQNGDLSPIDIHNLLSVDVEKIRQYVAASYELQQKEQEFDLDEENLKSSHKKGKSNPAYNKSTSVDSDIHLEMSWNSSTLSSNSKSTSYYKKTQLKRIHREPNAMTKFALVLLLLLKLTAKRPFYLLFQLILPAFMVTVLCYFVGQNPYDIPVAVYNPDSPAIVSRLVLNSMDKHTLRLVEYSSLNAALTAVRDHVAWGAIEFPSNYTNSMINRALQSCENNGDELDDEPEAESISGHLIEPNRQSDKLITKFNVPAASENDDELSRVYRDRSRFRRSIEKEETEEHDDTDHTDSSDSNGTSSTTPDSESPIEAHELINDLEVNRKKLKPINMITLKLYVDNTNLLVAGFIKTKVYHGLLKAQKDPSVAQMSPKIPSPLDIVEPHIYGEVDSPMSEFLLPGTLVSIIFLTASILPLPTLARIKQSASFEIIQMAGIGRLLVVVAFIMIELVILAIQIVLTLLAVETIIRHTILGPISLAYWILYLQGVIALLCTVLTLFGINSKNAGLKAMLFHITYFNLLIIFGGLFWPLESLPPRLRSVAAFVFPQTIGAESLRYIFSRGWGLEKYSDADGVNGVMWYAVNLPLATIGMVLILVVVTIRFFH